MLAFFRSRLFTPGFRLYIGIAGFLLVAAFVFGLATQIQQPGLTVGEAFDEVGLIEAFTGPLTIGWKGAVGNHVGYAVLLTGAAVSAFLAVVLIVYRDADPEAQAEVLGTETLPLTRPPQGTSFLPVMAALSVAVIAFGWVLSSVALYLGFAALALVAGTWGLRAWAERATGDPETNNLLYRRFIDPLRVPLLAVLCVGFVIFAFSRVLLAAPNTGVSAAAFGLVGLLFFIVTVLVALAPKIDRRVVVGLLVVGALVMLAGMVWGMAAGERDIEHHGEEGVAEIEPGGTEGMAPLPADDAPVNEGSLEG